MVEPSEMRFRPATGPAFHLPLGRYLPPVPPGMLRAWLADHAAPGSWLLDPLGASPAVTIEAARAGYKVIVASNNPILTFLLRNLAAAPARGELQSALAELAMMRRGEERLERHLQSLYNTPCAVCGDEVPAEAFLWRRGESQPYARIYRCPRCDAGLERGVEREISPSDLERLDLPGSDALHRSRALQRVVLSEDEYREDVEQALNSYLPRPLYALFTILNKLEGSSLPPERLHLLQALLISLLDAGSSLWPHPGGRSRPRQLLIPPQFRENNLWMALEDAAAGWAAWAEQWAGLPPLAVTSWPDLPDPAQPGGAIVLFRGRVKALVPLPEALAPKAIISAFPRPNQAFWTLSALWSGWLWGREAALPLRNVLDRRRYDWNWHTTALHSALAPLCRGIPAGTPFFGLLPDLAPGFLNATLIAAAAAGFTLEGLAMRVEGDLAQAAWRPVSAGEAAVRGAGRPASWDEPAVRRALRDSMRADLLARGEPAPYLTLSAAGMQALAQPGLVPESAPGAIPGDLFTRLQTSLTRAFSDRGFLRVTPARSDTVLAAPVVLAAPIVPAATEPSAESPGPVPAETRAGEAAAGSTTRSSPAAGDDDRSWWWLSSEAPAREARLFPPESGGPDLPLSDQIEMEVVRMLARSPVTAFSELDQALCERFCGLQTPSSELVRMILDSYGEAVPGQSGRWRLRAGETPAQRRSDLQQMRAALLDLGQRFNYLPVEESQVLVTWQADGAPSWRFYLMASSVASRYLLADSGDNTRRVLVLPGGRARLLASKLRRDPRLAAAAAGWHILKFRHLRHLAARAGLDRESFEALLAEDPLREDAVQMNMFAGKPQAPGQPAAG